jgi:hypothetical protein
MFHGHFPSRKTDADPYAILRNVYRMPDLFYSMLGGWTVSEALKEKLMGLPGTEFREVTFTRLVYVPWEVGEPVQVPPRAFVDDLLGGGIVPAKFFAALPRATPARRKVGRYYLFNPPAADVEQSHYRRGKPISFDFRKLAPEDTFVSSAPDGHPLSVAMMEDYPVVENWGYLFFTEELFRVIDRHLDSRFFIKGEITLLRRTAISPRKPRGRTAISHRKPGGRTSES